MPPFQGADRDTVAGLLKGEKLGLCSVVGCSEYAVAYMIVELVRPPGGNGEREQTGGADVPMGHDVAVIVCAGHDEELG